MDRLEIITTLDALLPLQRGWDDLSARAGSYYSQTFDWCWNSWATHCAGAAFDLRCIVIRADDRPVLIWPFAIRRTPLWRVARTLGQSSTEYAEVLVEKTEQADARVARALAVMRDATSCDIVSLPLVRAESVLDRVAPSCGAQKVHDERQQWTSWHGYPSWDAYYQSRPRSHRRVIERRRRRLQERGTVWFGCVEEADERSLIVNWVVRTKADWLRTCGLKPVWRDLDAFIKLLTTTEADAGGIVVLALKLNDAVIGAAVARRGHHVLELCVSAFDQNFARTSGAQDLYVHCLEWACANALDLDFRIGDEPYKLIWRTNVAAANYYRMPVSPWGSALHLGAKAITRSRRVIANRKPEISVDSIMPINESTIRIHSPHLRC